jgi:hypothetical protein
MHIGLLYIALTGLPILYALIAIPFGRAFSTSDYQVVLGTALKIRFVVYWSCVTIAHVFFIMTVIRGFSRKPAEETALQEEAGLLDDFRPIS